MFCVWATLLIYENKPTEKSYQIMSRFHNVFL